VTLALRFSCALLALLVLAPPGTAATAGDPAPMLVTSEDGQRLLRQGRDLMLAYRLDDAERVFARLAAADPQSPAAAAHLAKIAWWRAITMEQDELYDAFFERSDAVLAQARASGAGPWATLFRAETELQRAAIHAKKAEYARAAMALRRSFNLFQRNARQHPDFHESRWGLGLSYVTVGSVPRKYRWVLRLLGFRGTVTDGMTEIQAAARHATFYRDEAAVYYAILDEVINESRGGGMAMLRAAHARNPESPPMQYVLAFALLNQRQAAEAETLLRRADRAVARDGVYPIPYIDYYLGDALFRQNRFEEAASRFERFLQRFPGRAHRAQAALHAGLAREMLGDRAAAERHYRSVSVREDYDADASARREAETLLARPMTGRQRALLMGRNAYDGGRYREAVREVQGVLTDQSAPAVERAEAAYRSGRAYQALREWDEALRHYQFAISNPGDPLAKWGPWSQFYVGQVHAASGDRAAARQAYQRALDYEEPFEYHKGLEQRARAALEQL
jgi:tetratricopeptide (TPR) repeat protein